MMENQTQAVLKRRAAIGEAELEDSVDSEHCTRLIIGERIITPKIRIRHRQAKQSKAKAMAWDRRLGLWNWDMILIS